MGGLIVIGIPSQDFNQEQDSNGKVKAFCEATFGVDFPLAAISKVKGENAAPFYKWVKAQRSWEPSWNFNKVMVMRSSGGGNVVAYNYMQDGYGSYYPNQIENGLNASHMTSAEIRVAVARLRGAAPDVPVTVDLMLSVGGLSETVSVAADALLETSSTGSHVPDRNPKNDLPRRRPPSRINSTRPSSSSPAASAVVGAEQVLGARRDEALSQIHGDRRLRRQQRRQRGEDDQGNDDQQHDAA